MGILSMCLKTSSLTQAGLDYRILCLESELVEYVE